MHTVRFLIRFRLSEKVETPLADAGVKIVLPSGNGTWSECRRGLRGEARTGVT